MKHIEAPYLFNPHRQPRKIALNSSLWSMLRPWKSSWFLFNHVLPQHVEMVHITTQIRGLLNCIGLRFVETTYPNTKKTHLLWEYCKVQLRMWAAYVESKTVPGLDMWYLNNGDPASHASHFLVPKLDKLSMPRCKTPLSRLWVMSDLGWNCH